MNLSSAALVLQILTSEHLINLANADFNGIRRLSSSHHRHGNDEQRNLQACGGKKKSECSSTTGCEWTKGNCAVIVTSPPPPPPGPGPTPPTGPTNDCAVNTKAKDCKQDPSCEWLGGALGCQPLPTPPPTNVPTTNPTTSPTTSSNPTTSVASTFHPGDLTVSCDGNKLRLSTGMDCKLLTNEGSRVTFADSTISSATMHSNADGAGVIPHPTDGGWYYVSNSEVGSGGGGVGTLRFDSNGDLIDYKRSLGGTSRNCGGGVTPWNTWVTCEEDGNSGRCHEVDPHTDATQQVNVVSEGGNYESFAFDDQDTEWRYFTTEDSGTGALTRYTPLSTVYGGSDFDILSSAGGLHQYLVLDDTTTPMTFSWSTDLTAGEASASAFFPNSEGIDVHNRMLNFVSKAAKRLLTLDLENFTWTMSSTSSGLFNLQPDQIGRILNEGETLYFCEDGGSDCDIHGRDSTGNYFTLVQGIGYSTETTGLAFSPDGSFMYVAFQGSSNVYSFWRTDGLPFNGTVADTKYH